MLIEREERVSADADMNEGWTLLAFTSELEQEITPITVAGRPLMILRDGGRIRVADATCPHRGANLAYGSMLLDSAVKCPFHGRVIGIGSNGRGRYQLREHRAMEVDGVIFALLNPRRENGFLDTVTKLRQSRQFVPGFVLGAKVAPEYVIENVFDAEHFEAVHKVSHTPALRARTGDRGELIVEGALETRRPNRWHASHSSISGPVVTRFFARVFSPMLVVTELGDAGSSNVVVTGATPAEPGCVIRVAVAIPRAPDGGPFSLELARALLADSRAAFEQDLAVWEHLVPGAPEHFDECDEAVLEFRRFCDHFRHS